MIILRYAGAGKHTWTRFLARSASTSPRPNLPFPQRQPIWNTESIPYTLSTHIIPATYLRRTPNIQLPAPLADAGLDKTERKAIVKTNEAKLRLLRDQFEDLRTTTLYPKQLWICLNRYVKTSGPRTNGLTLVLGHANGFNKETWEPTLAHLLGSSQAVDEIWVWEAVQHGDSALLNAGQLNSLCAWSDAAQDLAGFLAHYLPTSISPNLPTHLPRVSEQESNRRIHHGFSDRTVVAVGHSFGGCTCALAALSHPNLFDSLVLVDPVIIRPRTVTKSLSELHVCADGNKFTNLPSSEPVPLALGALARRNAWSSKEEALKTLSASPFFKIWDPEVLKLYVEYGIYNDKGVYRLKTAPIHEAVSFIGMLSGAEEAWMGMMGLDERIELRWIVPGEGQVELGAPGSTKETVQLRPVNSTSVMVAGVGHLITQHAPKLLAKEIEEFIARKYFNLTIHPRITRAHLKYIPAATTSKDSAERAYKRFV